MTRLVALVLTIAALAATAPEPAADPPSLTVFAAADLAFAFREVATGFERATGSRVKLVFGSTGNFAHQIRHGGPADVFFAADQSFVDALVEEEVLLRETRTLYARGRIVLATSRAYGSRLADLRGLTDPRVRRVAIANPAHAPYGRAGEEALRRTGVWEAIRPKLVYGENIRHALQFIQTGAVEAGIVALSVANVPEVEWTPIPAALHAPLDQLAAVVRRSQNPDLALAFIRFVNAPAGRAIMRRYGFLLPGEF